ncbi:MAG: methylmalonyl-CoA mutase [Deltaproteobacteria bacterium]|jgi:methylmalonyl-CoA mutase, N-terminal domain|nr:methylmalonyl-CoA mutase [Deltaproteobacteria bacterium]MBT4268429.1 methylmalonyl-CoA mutase [Deltaproteobacteria bacterium]MBT4642675.1 methylmalonyl-CoA mutase [Deltaproteobacteria bacterium]
MFDQKTMDKDQELKNEWSSKFEKVRKRFQPDQSYHAETSSGIPIKPFYSPEDVSHIPFSEIGVPGEFPYTRGIYPMGYQFMPWANQQLIGCGTPEETRKRMDYLTDQGMVGYFGKPFFNMIYDLATHGGFDPSDRAAIGRIGECGLSSYCTESMEVLFKDMELDKINVSHVTKNQTLVTFATYVAYAQSRGYKPEQLRGNTMNWYHTYNVCSGLATFPPEMCDRLAAELIWFCTKNMPKWNTTNLFGYGVEESGSNAVQEIALIVSAGISISKRCIGLGLEPDEFLPRFGFQIAQASDFFEEIAKIRALRKIWAKTNSERFGAKNPQSMHVRIHAHTAGSTLTAQQPLVNVIRTTIQALGAALSGVQAMEVPGYDEALAIPTEEAARLALRIQQVISEETNIKNVSDPLGGSYYMESLTSEIEKQAMAIIDQIEEKGGFIEAWETGFIRSMIDENARKIKEKIDSKEQTVVGVNKYVMEEEQKIPIFKIDSETPSIEKTREDEFKKKRDPVKHEQSLKKLEECLIRFKDGDNDHSLIPNMIEAAGNGATNGEMMWLMKNSLGWISSAALTPA